MSNNTPKEKQKADSFVGRLSKVVMCLASIGAGFACFALTMPGLDPARRDFNDTLFGVSILGWPAYLAVIYLFGRFQEASDRCLSLGQDKGGNFYVLSLIPLAVVLLVAPISWLMWRLPDGIRWVAELFGR
jgi:hypothetical protein